MTGECDAYFVILVSCSNNRKKNKENFYNSLYLFRS